MAHKEKYSFLELIEKHPVVIPIIQRDYAQGRTTEKAGNIRNQFLADLLGVLNESDTQLVLDFVYGSLKSHKTKHGEPYFVPLDGQQRLTTLFLLHWYLMPDGDNPLRGEDGSARFVYETRNSSTDFCKKLITQPRRELADMLAAANAHRKPEHRLSMADIIRDQNWYLWAWNNDPTIKGMLVMLEDLHARIGTLAPEDLRSMWERLCNGAIVFNLLLLDQFNLEDELYIKMNARGKELSPFDLFKSTLEEQMQKNGVSEELYTSWIEKVNCKWMDFFWHKRLNDLTKDKNGNIALSENTVASVEQDYYLVFLKRMMFYHLFLQDDCLHFSDKIHDIQTLSAIPASIKIEENISAATLLDRIRDYAVQNDILKLVPALCQLGFFEENFFRFIHDYLEAFISGDGGQCITDLLQGVRFEPSDSCHSQDLLQRFLASKITYEMRVQFFAALVFAKNYPQTETTTEALAREQELHNWLGLIRNLSTNVNTYYYNTKDDFRASLKSLERWAAECYGPNGSHDSVTYMASLPEEMLIGFNKEQLKEEKRKARLKQQNSSWETPLSRAENHPYFVGQIRFLLDWACDDLEKFQIYSDKMEKLFEEEGIRLNENRFRACLLCLGDYTMGYGNDGKSFLGGGKSRDFSWKRYLRDGKCDLLKKLVDRFAIPGDSELE